MSKFIYLGFFLLSVSFNVTAKVYRCEGPDGRMAFQSTPCAGVVSEKVEIYIPLNAESDEYYEQQRIERHNELVRRSNEARLERERQETYSQLIREKKVAIGMSPDQVKRSWGSPCRVNRTISAHGNTEQWVYCYDNNRSDYVHFRDGEVSSISN